MASLKQHAGYLVVDHRDSPGITPADVAHVPGAIPVGAGTLLERDVLTCTHCQRAVLLEPLRARERGYCPKCNHYVCDRCEAIRVKTGVCVPMVQVLDQAQAHVEQFIGREDHPDASQALLLTDRFKEY